MIVTFIPYCPQSEGKNLGFAYNALMDRLQDDDWACFIDHDACFTTYDWYAQLEEITARLTEPCVLTAMTNRVGSLWQLTPGVDRDHHSMAYHRQVGTALQEASRTSLRDVTHESLMSGVVILLSKKTWRLLGGFANGFLGVDNALHQAAREQGCQVYLMEGVYVYHWYRADGGSPALIQDAGRSRTSGEFENPAVDPSNGHRVPAAPAKGFVQDSGGIAEEKAEFDEANPAIWGKVHVTGHRILVIDQDVSRLGRVLQHRGAARLVAVELDPAALDRARGLFTEVFTADEDGVGPEFEEGSFDGIFCGGVLERVPRPERILHHVRKWLATDGRLVAVVGNTRRLDVVEGLLAGRWTAASGRSKRRPLRFYTRREVEKLLFRAGFSLASMTPLPGEGHAGWKAGGRQGTVKVGRLHIGGLASDEAEEFFTRGFLIEATPGEIPDFGMTSIVIVTHNQLEYTHGCVESIRHVTDEPYELIFVDNASTDGTADYVRSLPGAKLIVNSENRGFPAAVNQGMALAKGRQILLLNNDTVVTTGWLRRLLRTLYSDRRIGLVGPCSNRVSGTQEVEVRYEDLANLDGFAWEWGKSHEGVVEDSNRLIGFCLLIRQEVAEAIGTLDEQFGIGCFEDDDYCLRALQAGWRAVIARDAFVHHYGGRTFVGSGADFAGIMRENEQRFRAKWESKTRQDALPQETGPSLKRQPGPYTVVMAPEGGLLLQRQHIRLSLCMIVRDSSRTLPACLESIRPWVDEMVIVDTGSVDDTPRIVESFGGRLFHFPWIDDFSAARNESLRHARGEWLFWMDSDDTINPDCGRRLRELAYSETDPSILGFVVQVHCPGGGDDGSDDVTAVDHVKLFRNRPDLRFDGRIHEQILPAIRQANGEVAWTDLYVVHSGSDPGHEAQERKRQRDLRILHQELKERPDHPFTLFNLGMTYNDGGRYEEAIEFLTRGIARSGPHESHLRKAYALLIYAQMQLRRTDDAGATCRKARQLFPDDAELRFRQGVLLHDLGCLDEAARAYRDVLENREERHFSSVDRGIFGFKARQNLAVVYSALGQLSDAEAEWRLVVQEVPRYRPGWVGLGDSLLRQGKVAELQAVVTGLQHDETLGGEMSLLSGWLAVASGNPQQAREAFERAVQERPNEREHLQAFCQFLFEHGNPDEAEQALKALVASDPNDASAHHNLGTLYLRHQRYREAAASYEESLRHRPDFPAAYLHLGYALKESGQLGRAIAAWEQVLRLSPGDPSAEEELRSVGRLNALTGSGKNRH